jgi:hypothetical protein
MYFIQHCFTCRPSDPTVSEDAGIELRTVATPTLAVRRSNHSARSHPLSARSHDLSGDSFWSTSTITKCQQLELKSVVQVAFEHSLLEHSGRDPLQASISPASPRKAGLNADQAQFSTAFGLYGEDNTKRSVTIHPKAAVINPPSLWPN